MPVTADALLTSLLGGNGETICLEVERIGAPEPCENAMDWESGPTLDRRLSCWDSGRSDMRRIHEPFEENESRESAPTRSPGCLVVVACGRRLEDRGGVSRASEERRGNRGGGLAAPAWSSGAVMALGES